jgi:hypothetical protein
MRTAIIYRVHLGTAREYIDWLHEEIESDLYEFAQIKNEDFDKYDSFVIFSGNYAGQLQLYYFLKSRADLLRHKRVAVALVGNISGSIAANFRFFFRLPEEIRNSFRYFTLPGRLLDFSRKEVHKAYLSPIIGFLKEDRRAK